uniref:Nuclease HARBI1 n=1 Tax=Romanomermis culicivorax TaxID=13658 RepID=A0A915HQ81_ROMCU
MENSFVGKNQAVHKSEEHGAEKVSITHRLLTACKKIRDCLWNANGKRLWIAWQALFFYPQLQLLDKYNLPLKEVTDDKLGLSKPTICRVVEQVSLALLHFVPTFIIYPKDDEILKFQEKFYEM